MAIKNQPFPATAVTATHRSAFSTPLLKHARRISTAMAVLLILALPAVAETLPTQTFRLGEHTLLVELAISPEDRSRGLMERESMDEYEGMLFVYEDLGYRCFWMQNTLIPLTLAFIADDGTVLQLTDMEPMTTKTHCSTGRVRYALELNQGWFERNDVSVGDQLLGL